MRNILKLVFIVTTAIAISGCGSIPEADPEAISNFKPHALKDGDDIGLYLIRPNQFAGGGRDYWVALDDKVIGDLENNTYVFMSLNSKDDSSVNTVISFAGQNFIGIPEGTKEKQYYYYSVDFTTWIPRQLSSDIGKTLVSQLKEHELDYKQRPNDGYDNLAMNPSMLTNYMSPLGTKIKPDSGHSVVYFFRPASTEKAMSLPVSVWTEHKHLGSLNSKQFFKVKVPVGRTAFYRKDGKFHSIEIDVEPNKYYYVELQQSFSFTGNNHSLNYLGAETDINDMKVNRWITTLEEFTPINEEEWTERQKLYVEQGLNYLYENKTSFIEENK